MCLWWLRKLISSVEKLDIIVEQSYKYINYCICGFLSIMICRSCWSCCLALFCQTYSRAVLLQILSLISPSSSFLVWKQVSECSTFNGGSWGIKLPSADIQLIFPVPVPKQYQHHLSIHLYVCFLLKAVLLWPMVIPIPFFNLIIFIFYPFQINAPVRLEISGMR